MSSKARRLQPEVAYLFDFKDLASGINMAEEEKEKIESEVKQE